VRNTPDLHANGKYPESIGADEQVVEEPPKNSQSKILHT
jgi:hypothetical protein